MNDKAKNDVDALLAEVIKTLASLIEEKDAFLRGHAERVAARGVALARYLQLPPAQMRHIYLAGLLHDVGMVCLPHDLLGKPNAISDDERLVMEQHPVIAERILSPLSLVQECLPAIRHHHEAFDGSGYPDGLRGEEIPAAARMLAIVDGYEAMTASRPHRTAMPAGRALGEVLGSAGRRYDPALVKRFVDFMGAAEKVQPTTADVEEPAPEAVVDPGSESRLGGRDLVLELVSRLKDGVPELPVLPAVAARILKGFDNPTTSTDKLVSMVEMDAVLTIGVITAANSAWHGGIDKIVSVRKAVPRLGFEESRKAVASTANLHIFRNRNRRFIALMEQLWLHSLACAYASREIGRATKIGDEDDVFLMGLMHDVGKLPLLKILCRIDDRQGQSLDIGEVLKSIQDVHGSFGAAILKRWGFAREFQRVASLHDKRQFTNMTDKGVLIVHIANRIAHQAGFGLEAGDSAEAPDGGDDDAAQSEAAAMIGLGAEAAAKVRRETDRLMKTGTAIFKEADGG